MQTALSNSDVEKLVAEEAKQLDRDVTPDLVHVYEDPHSSDGRKLIVEIAVKRHADRADWTKQRLRFSQAVRDMLIEKGDDRYPVLVIFGPDEWAHRND